VAEASGSCDLGGPAKKRDANVALEERSPVAEASGSRGEPHILVASLFALGLRLADE
jgi:hypothetical protein